jgi:hypothetical protein
MAGRTDSGDGTLVASAFLSPESNRQESSDDLHGKFKILQSVGLQVCISAILTCGKCCQEGGSGAFSGQREVNYLKICSGVDRN